MKISVKKLLLLLLKGLVYGKRLLVWFFGRFSFIANKLEAVWQNTVGFRLYRLGFSWKRIFGKIHLPWSSRLFSFFGQRSIMQVILFCISFIVMLPHTNFVKADNNLIPGRKTVLYELVGPGDEVSEIEEIVVDVTSLVQKDTRSWKEGSVISELPTVGGELPPFLANEISGISVGGSAVTKPTILPGTKLPTQDVVENKVSGRTEVVLHEVQPGDVIGAIAEKYGISVATILYANNLSSRSLIRPGDKLKILPSTGVVHTVKRGDTVEKIARIYDTEKEKIIASNRLKNDGSDIVVGEELIVPDGVPPVAVQVVAPVRSNVFSRIVAPLPSIAVPAGSGYIWPTGVRRISQYYGWRHTGLDIAGPIGTPNYAISAGTVIKSQCGWNGGYGCYIIIDHGGGIQSLYGHNKEGGLLVSVGERVVQGQTIGLMGSTGRSTGPHIHFEIRVSGTRVNPLQYIR